MLRISAFCMLLTLAVAQSGYDYNKPNRPFRPGASSNRPGSLPGSSTGTTSYPIRPQDDYSDNEGPTTGYSTGSNYPGSSSQRPGYEDSYPQGPSGPSEYSGQMDSYPGSRGSAGFPGQGTRYPGSGSRYPGQEQNFPGHSGIGFGTSGFTDDTGNYEGGDYSAIPGEPGIDYPVLSYIPQTSFNCKSQLYPGYYSDVETRCQVFHVCANNNTYDFLCPNGTVFSQEHFVCVWWDEFNCESAPSLYELNAKIYDYSIKDSSGNYPVSSLNDYQGSSYPGRPRGPSSYSGTQGPSNYPGSGTQGPSTPYAGGTGSYPNSQGPFGYTGSGGPSGSYPGSQGHPASYTGSQGTTGSYSDSQGPSNGYPVSGTYPTGPQNPNGPSGSTRRPNSGYSNNNPNNSYSGSTPGSQGYPSGRPSGPGFQSGSNRSQPAQKPNREYLPPRN